MESPDVCEIEARRWQDTFASVRACGMHASLILTDPPYGTTCNSWDEPVDSDEFVDASLKLLGERGVFVSTTAEPYTSSEGSLENILNTAGTGTKGWVPTF